MSTLRVSNIEAKADASSPSVNEKVKVTNSSGDVLIHVNGETTGITTVGVNTTGKTFDVNANQKVSFAGDIITGGNVGIGTDNPYANAGTNLHIHSANTTSEIRLTNSTTGGGLNGSIVQQGGNTLYISNSESGNTVFENAGSERARITSTGNVQIANGNLVFSTSGTGIDFSASSDSSATGATVTGETLTDYEEGTWTPYWSQLGGGVLFDNDGLTVHQAFYRRLNNMVFYHTYMYSDASFSYATGVTATTNAYIGGLPFPCNGYQSGTVGYFSSWTGWSASYTPMVIGESGQAVLRLNYAVANTVSQIQAQYLLSANSSIICSGFYLTS
jgi:hypothetical protein